MQWPGPRTAAHWRLRAEEVRTIADNARPHPAQLLRRIAKDYDRLADYADNDKRFAGLMERLAADYAVLTDND